MVGHSDGRLVAGDGVQSGRIPQHSLQTRTEEGGEAPADGVVERKVEAVAGRRLTGVEEEPFERRLADRSLAGGTTEGLTGCVRRADPGQGRGRPHEGAATHVTRNETLALSLRVRTGHRADGHPESVRQIAMGGQTLALLEAAVANVLGERVGDDLVERTTSSYEMGSPYCHDDNIYIDGLLASR